MHREFFDAKKLLYSKLNLISSFSQLQKFKILPTAKTFLTMNSKFKTKLIKVTIRNKKILNLAQDLFNMPE